MGETQMLFQMESKEFWQKLKMIIEQVVIEHGNFGITVEEKIRVGSLMKATEVCAHLRITKPTLYQWMNQGKLPSIKIESRRFFRWEDVEKLIESGKESIPSK